MKKIIIFISGLLFGLLMIPTASAISEYLCKPVSYPVIIDGVQYQAELPLLNYDNGNTYAPLRSLLIAAGYDVTWDGEAAIATFINASKDTTTDDGSKTMADRARDGEIPMTITTPDGVASVCYIDGYYISRGVFDEFYKGKGFYFYLNTHTQIWSIKNRNTDETIIDNIPLMDKRWIAYDYYCAVILSALSN